MARKQTQGGNRGRKGRADKPAGRQQGPAEAKLNGVGGADAALGGGAAGAGAHGPAEPTGGTPHAGRAPRPQRRGAVEPRGTDTGKVGSDPDAARSFGGKGDFGAHVTDTIERDYTSANTKASDVGAAQPSSAAEGSGPADAGPRTSGAGGKASGVGASSGGDLDTDIVGVGFGGNGLAQSAPRGTSGPDDSDGSSREFASGPPAKGESGPKAGKVEGTTVDGSGEDMESDTPGRGASAVSRAPRGDPDRPDDSFVGEVSDGEASGDDNSPSDNA